MLREAIAYIFAIPDLIIVSAIICAIVPAPIIPIFID
jgi:hypothetical protein